MIAMIAMRAEAATTIPTTRPDDKQMVLAERARIARELHDGLLQDAMTIALHLRAVLPNVRAASEDAALALMPIVELAEKTTKEARRAIMGMRAAEVDERLVDAIENTVHCAMVHSTVKVSTAVMGHVRAVRADLQDAIVRIVREAATNIQRHARAHTVRITIVFASRRLRVTIDDDGKGFDPSAVGMCADHFGLIGMRERARALRGSLDVRSQVGLGTTVTLDLPLNNSHE
jgi:signal transduction histidine kinase